MKKVKKLWSRLKEEKEFLKKVKKAGEITFQTGHEAHFEAIIRDKKLIFGKVVEATSERCLTNGVDHLYNGSVPYMVGSFHFHPESNCVIEPSLDDLFLLTTEPPNKMNSWIAVGHIDNQGNLIKILFMTPENKKITINDINYVNDYFMNQEEVINDLEEIGIQTEVIYQTI